jgi:hypothetical protein
MKAHSFSPGIAEAYGLRAAVIFQYIQYRWQKAATEKKNYLIYERRYWCPIRLEDFRRQYSYLGPKATRNAIRRLLKGHKGNPPMLRRIRNCFYAVTGDIDNGRGRHKFDPEIAERCGIVEAILVHNLWYWCHHNFDQAKIWIEGAQNAEDYDYDNDKASEAAIKKGLEKAWHYVSAEKLLEQHPYVSRATIFRALQHLQKTGILRKKYLGDLRVLRMPSWSFSPRFMKHYHNHPESRSSKAFDSQRDEPSQSQNGHHESQNGHLESQYDHPESQNREENQLYSLAGEPFPEPLKAVVVKSGNVGSGEMLKTDSVADALGSGSAVASGVRQQPVGDHRYAVKIRERKQEIELNKHSPEFRKAFVEYNGLLQSGGNPIDLERAKTRYYEARNSERDQFEEKASRSFEGVTEGTEGEIPDAHRHQNSSSDQHRMRSNSTASSIMAAGTAPQAQRAEYSNSGKRTGAARHRKTAPTLRQMRKKHANQTRKKSEKFDPNDYGDFEPERMQKIIAWEKAHGVHWSCFKKSNSATSPT